MFAQILTFFPLKIDIDRNTCHFASKFARHYFITALGNSLNCPKTDAFLHKMLFFTKRKQCHQKLTLFKNTRYFIKKNLISPLKTNIYENDDHLLQK